MKKSSPVSELPKRATDEETERKKPPQFEQPPPIVTLSMPLIVSQLGTPSGSSIVDVTGFMAELTKYGVQKLQLIALDLGGTVSKSIASSLVATSISAATKNAIVQGLSQCGNLTSAAQLQALGVIALRIPLQHGTRLSDFCSVIANYAASNCSAINQIAALSVGAQVIEVGLKGSVISTVASIAVQQALATAYFVQGSLPLRSFKYQTVTIGVTALGSVSGGVLGAAVGSLVFPGAGTALGSLFGSFAGALLPSCRRADAFNIPEDPKNPSRKVVAMEYRTPTNKKPQEQQNDKGGTSSSLLFNEEEWLEVVDCDTVTYFHPNPSEYCKGQREGCASSFVFVDYSKRDTLLDSTPTSIELDYEVVSKIECEHCFVVTPPPPLRRQPSDTTLTPSDYAFLEMLHEVIKERREDGQPGNSTMVNVGTTSQSVSGPLNDTITDKKAMEGVGEETIVQSCLFGECSSSVSSRKGDAAKKATSNHFVRFQPLVPLEDDVIMYFALPHEETLSKNNPFII